MHPNYRKLLGRSGAAALPRWPILSNRSGVTVCAFDGERNDDGLS
jgi:hypothetical protein